MTFWYIFITIHFGISQHHYRVQAFSYAESPFVLMLSLTSQFQ